MPNATWLESSRAGLGSKPSGSWDPNSSVACCSDRKWPPERRVIRPWERGKGTQSRACLKLSSGRVAGGGAWRRNLAGTALGSWKGRRRCRWKTRPTRAVALASRAPRVKLPTLACLQDLGYSHVLGACSATALITGMGWEATSVRSSLRARVPHW